MTPRETIRYIHRTTDEERRKHPHLYSPTEHMAYDRVPKLPESDEEMDKMIDAMKRGDMQLMKDLGTHRHRHRHQRLDLTQLKLNERERERERERHTSEIY